MKCKVGRQDVMTENLYYTVAVLVGSKFAGHASPAVGRQIAGPLIGGDGVMTVVRETFLQTDRHARMITARASSVCDPDEPDGREPTGGLLLRFECSARNAGDYRRDERADPATNSRPADYTRNMGWVPVAFQTLSGNCVTRPASKRESLAPCNSAATLIRTVRSPEHCSVLFAGKRLSLSSG